jgi:orotidine-5'-phosphate decarboxylase
VRRIFGESAKNVIVTSSRSMLANGLDGLDAAITTKLETLKSAL